MTAAQCCIGHTNAAVQRSGELMQSGGWLKLSSSITNHGISNDTASAACIDIIIIIAIKLRTASCLHWHRWIDL